MLPYYDFPQQRPEYETIGKIPLCCETEPCRSGISLNKSDICANVEARIKDVKAIAQDVPIYAISATEGIGMQPVSLYLQEGKTVVLLGSSGVGKSTLINAWR